VKNGKRIWLFLETVRPLRWGIRYGNKWHVVNDVVVKLPMQTMQGKKPPNGYLAATGSMTIRNGVATLEKQR
jgi:hypothetical protein